ncbi:MAG TPA: BON domain-containing protein [Bryobacteraceae bacterium]
MGQKALVILLFATFGLVWGGCDRPSREEARDREAETQQKIKKMGREAREKVRKLDRDIQATVQPEGNQGSAKLDDAALLAKVKARLASDTGLATLKNVDVDTRGSVVTLRGTVESDAQRQQAERAASQVNGVTRVVNELKVTP